MKSPLVATPPIYACAQDLEGRTLSAPADSSSHYQLLYFIKLLRLENVNVRTAEPNLIDELWQRGDIDAAFVWEPHLARLKQADTSAHVLISGGAVAECRCQPVCEMYGESRDRPETYCAPNRPRSAKAWRTNLRGPCVQAWEPVVHNSAGCFEGPLCVQ